MREESATAAQLTLARRLWYGSYAGVLSTHSQALPGYPFGSLVTLCLIPSGRPLLLLSHLAQHTRNLQANPSCSLILLEKGEGDVQQLGRLTCLARAEALDQTPTTWQEKFFQYFPDTRHYHEALNFRFFQLRPQRFHFIGGFGAARWFDTSRLLPKHRFSTAKERELLNQAQAIYLASHRGKHDSLRGVSRVVGVDSYGIDLRAERRLSRIQFASPTDSAEAFLEALRTTLDA